MNKLILDHLSTAVLVLDRQLRLQYMNPAAENLLAASLSQIKGHYIDSVFAAKAQWSQEIQRVFASGSSLTQRQLDLQLATNFRHITVDCTVSPMMDEQQNSFVLMELQSLDRLLRINREEALMSSEQTSRTFIRSLAHEIKNPLGGIRGAAQLLARKLSEPGLQDYTRVIIDEADRLRNLVDRMLGINKPLQMGIVNVHEVLEHVAALIEAEGLRQITLTRDYDPSIPDIRGDKEQLVQVVLNIVRNAVQVLLASGQEEKRIVLKTRTRHHFTIGQKQHKLVCRVDVIDNGPGIPPEIADNIFYPLISGRPDGSGLGLAIAQSIVVQHSGLIEYDSKPGETVFSIYLPLDNKSG